MCAHTQVLTLIIMISFIKPGKFKHRQALQCFTTGHILKRLGGKNLLSLNYFSPSLPKHAHPAAQII